VFASHTTKFLLRLFCASPKRSYEVYRYGPPKARPTGHDYCLIALRCTDSTLGDPAKQHPTTIAAAQADAEVFTPEGRNAYFTRILAQCRMNTTLHPPCTSQLKGPVADAAPDEVSILRKALSDHPDDPTLWFDLGEALLARQAHDEALHAFQHSREFAPDRRETYFYLGVAAQASGSAGAAADYYAQALRLSPDWPEALYNAALVHQRLGDLDTAATLLQNLIAQRPDWAPAWLNLGSVRAAAEKWPAALACWQRALLLAPDHVHVLFNCGRALQALNRMAEATEFYCRALAIAPDYAKAHIHLAQCCMARMRCAEAVTHYRRAVELQPDYAAAWYGLAHAHILSGDLQAAIASFRKVLDLDPQNPAAHFNLAVALQRLEDIDAAMHHCRMALSLSPGFAGARTFLFELARHACDWRLAEAMAPELDRLTQDQLAKRLKPAESPMLSLRRNADPAQNLMVAHAFSQGLEDAGRHFREYAPSTLRPRGGRLRIGYISSDFKDHAVAHHLLGLIEAHDRSSFEIYGYACNPEDGSYYRRRLLRAFDHFVCLDSLDNIQAAQRIHADGIALLVDMMGYTRGGRLEILALRPAPVQVAYLGFLGTSGADFIDYLIADSVVVPPEAAAHYTEKIAYLPGCYQVNDNRMPIAEQPKSRKVFDLPDDAIVFCCFNQPYKIDRPLFQSWLNILRSVPGSLLWLLAQNRTAMRNMCTAADQAGIDPGRLRYSGALRIDHHLARLQLADIALDPFIYNGGATTANALWAGVPVVSRIGGHFVSRMSASALVATGLSCLIAASAAEYETIAVDLARDKAKRLAIRRHLTDRRAKLPLFDTQAFARHIETAFDTMLGRYRQGLRPATFTVESVANASKCCQRGT
jgi:protein O-GlcNAc transferase